MNSSLCKLYQFSVRRLSPAICLTTSRRFSQKDECKVLVVGAGTGGCSMAAKFASQFKEKDVIVLEPADKHYYQPMFTLIGGGMKRLEQAVRPMEDVIPKDANWIKERAIYFNPDSDLVISASGREIKYEVLIVAMGLKTRYDKVLGLEEALETPNGNVCSIYSPKYVEDVYEVLQRVENGNAIFTFPESPIKCPGAPQKIAYVAEHYFRRTNKRDKINVIYSTALPVLFGVKYYADALWEICNERNIQVKLTRNLIEVRPQENIAIFENVEKPSEIFRENYSMLHVVPPMYPPEELANCKTLTNEAGFVHVDNQTMQHVKYKNVFAIGDCSSTPNSKTAAAAAAQSPVVFNNVMSYLNGKEPEEVYDGYASCPLVTGFNRCILAEFDYNLKPLETFPVHQNKERYSMFFLKKELMPSLYWNVMLPGHWNGPALMRNAFSFFKSKK